MSSESGLGPEERTYLFVTIFTFLQQLGIVFCFGLLQHALLRWVVTPQVGECVGIKNLHKVSLYSLYGLYVLILIGTCLSVFLIFLALTL